MTGRGGDHDREEEVGCKAEGCREEEGVGEVVGAEEDREEDREEVVLPVVGCPGVDEGKVYLVGVDAGKAASRIRNSLPKDWQDADVTVTPGYSDEDEDEDMRTVREVHEEAPDVLRVTVSKTLPVALERISISVEVERT